LIPKVKLKSETEFIILNVFHQVLCWRTYYESLNKTSLNLGFG
jgi:hypothetical protein